MRSEAHIARFWLRQRRVSQSPSFLKPADAVKRGLWGREWLLCVQYRHRVRYRFAFCLKKRGSLNLKPKTQAVICFEGCSAAGQHVLAVLPTGYGKYLTDLRAVAAKHVGNRNVSVF